MNASGNFAPLVRSILTLRADQNRMFGHPLSAPAWDMIFVLFLAEIEGRPTRAQDAAFIAGIDPQAARRWIAHLKSDGIVIDCDSMGENCITLSADAADKLRTFVLNAQTTLGSA